MVYQNFSKVFIDMDAYVYMKQRKAMQDSLAVYFKVHKHFLGPDPVARKAEDAEGKLQNLRERYGIWTSMSPTTKNSIPPWKVLWIMAIVV